MASKSAAQSDTPTSPKQDGAPTQDGSPTQDTSPKQDAASKGDNTPKDAGASGAEQTAKSAKQDGSGEQAGADKPPEAKQGRTPGDGEAVKALKADHRMVEALFNEFESADERRREQIIEEACHALVLHTILEEDIFYPACRERFDEDDPLNEAQVEHDSVKLLILDLEQGDSKDPFRAAKFQVLAEQVRHHVREEEEADGIFRKAQSCGIDTPDLARRLMMRREQLEAGHTLPKPQPRSIHIPSSAPSQGRAGGKGNPQSFGAGQSDTGRFEERDMASYQQYRDRDDQGRFMRHDDNDRSDRRGNDRARDEDGRFTSSGRSSRRDDDDDRDQGRYGRSSQSRYRDDDDYDRRGSSRGDDDRGESSRGGDNRGRSHGGWFGDSEGHSQASRRGWENSDHGRSGWYGDPEGHSEASRRGWEDRGASTSTRSRDDDDDRGRGRSRSQDDDDRRYASRGRDDDDGRRGGHGGWSGDSRGHSEAARRGWENRR